jgi:hypothetical protein
LTGATYQQLSRRLASNASISCAYGLVFSTHTLPSIEWRCLVNVESSTCLHRMAFRRCATLTVTTITSRKTLCPAFIRFLTVCIGIPLCWHACHSRCSQSVARPSPGILGSFSYRHRLCGKDRSGRYGCWAEASVYILGRRLY